ncbi:MAG: hypothetical protein K6G61_09180 [Solobacterium sp.]|nr:hypothetical protein [Solobacterium sp.]
MKTIHKIFILLGLIALIILFLYYDANHIAVSRFSKRYQELSSEKIPEQMNDINILYFSDLEYGTFMDEERLGKLVDTINGMSADIVLFGGDMYDAQASVTQSSNSIIRTAFTRIEAPLGKFAVLGDNDLLNSSVQASVEGVLKKSDFEILDNASVNLHNSGSQSIALVGIANGLNGIQNFEQAYRNVSRNSYTIAMCHTPDSADSAPADLTDYFLSGHSHGGQTYFIITAGYTPAMATKYLRGRHKISDSFILDISTGTGTTGSDVRFMADPEIVVYTLKHEVSEEERQKNEEKEKPKPSATPEPAAETPLPEEQQPETAPESREEVPQEEYPEGNTEEGQEGYTEEYPEEYTEEYTEEYAGEDSGEYQEDNTEEYREETTEEYQEDYPEEYGEDYTEEEG